jgi:hypothetical protein
MSDSDGAGDVPVLTQVVEDVPPARPPIDAAALEALARRIEQDLIERLGPQIQRLTTQAVHEAVAAALAQALGEPQRD